MDMLESNAFPPNVTLSPSNNAYMSPVPNKHMETNPMMMYTQQATTHIQHHPNPGHNLYYRQTPPQQQQQQQQPMYNNFVQPPPPPPPPPPPNQVAPGYYSMPQQTSPQQQRMSSAIHPSQLNKRQIMPQQRTPQQNNPQLQLHMSMNVTLPNVGSTKPRSFPFFPYI